MESPDLARMRTEYARVGLDETDAGDDPLALLTRWLHDAVAAGVYEPNAMALATATPEGRPSNRIVLLKGFDAAGLRFFTNYESRKGGELTANPYAAAVLLWHPIQRQVRVEGVVTRLPADESDAYFDSRPRGSQLGAIASPQSAVIADRAELDARQAQVEHDVGAAEPRRPVTWGGYLLAPEIVEFWHGREGRLHDRLRFTRTPDGWSSVRLAP